MALTREAILGAADLAPTEVKVPEWGGVILLRRLSVADIDAWRGAIGKDTTDNDAMLALTVMTAVGEDGAPLFTREDMPALRQRSAQAMKRVFRAAAKLNGLAAGAIEDAEKN